MHVIALDVEFENLDLFRLTQDVDVMLYEVFDRPGEDAKAILGHPDDVVVALVDDIGELAVFALSFGHARKVRHSRRYITTVTDGGFLQ